MSHSLRLPILATLLGATTVAAQELPDSTRSRLPGRTAADSVGAAGAMGGLPARERGVAISVLDADADGIGAAPSLPIALQARLPGVSVRQGEGILGSASRVWLRGPSSLVVNEPLLIIDGARAHAAGPIRPFVNRGMPSRLEDIDMETVQRVEILRGPAAAAIHGPAASKGVILVTTKRGQPGAARWTAFAESGPSFEATTFPGNFGTLGMSGTTPVANCPLAQQAAGSCTPTTRQFWNPLESASPFRTGWTNGAGISVSGHAAPITYFAAGSHDRAEGVYVSDRSRATSGRVGLSMSPSATVDVHVTGGYRADHLRHPANSWIGSALLGDAVDNAVSRGYAGGFPRLARQVRDEDVDRTTLALNAAWRPQPWFQAGVVLGYDRLGVDTDLAARDPRSGVPQPSADSATRIERTSDRPEARTGAIDATASYVLNGVAARSSVGIQYVREDDRGSNYDAIIPDGQTIPEFVSRSEMQVRGASTGLYVQQHLGWNDRLFVTGSLRADRANRGDIDLDNTVSPSLDVAWVAIDARRPKAPRWIGDLRLRAAYGRGGAHAVPTLSDGFPGTVSTRMAEQGSELEAGADASLLGGQVRAALTYYRATTSRGFVRQPSEVVSNTAGVRTSGVESSIEATLVRRSGFTWAVEAIVSAHRNEIESLGSAEFGTGIQFVTVGSSIGEYFSWPYSFADANGDGLIAASEVSVRPEGFRSVGTPDPSVEAALRTGLTLGGSVRLTAVLDHRSGATLYNQTARQRCRTRCEEQHDPATPLARQARSIAAQLASENGYFEDADFTKLREVRMALLLPRRVARIGGASSARITLTGRNLYTWTPYKGLDPEVVSARYDATVAADSFLQPPLRSFTARLDLTW
jgi:hypothetical protein